MAFFSGDIYSQKLKMTTNIKIIIPELSNDVTPLFTNAPKLLILLHGLGGNSSEWTRFTKIEYYSKKYNFFIVMPEVQRSFYFNTSYGINYFSYVSNEIIEIIKKWFKISTKRENVYIAGESMGGYGALKIALRNNEKFNSVAVLSGIVNMKQFINKVINEKYKDIQSKELKGIINKNLKLSKKDDLYLLLQSKEQNIRKPKIIQICGKNDFLYEQNLEFKNKISKLDYQYTFLEWEGEHSWPFWDIAIQKSLQYFRNLDLNQTPLY
ncbi:MULTISPECIES: alpha/beta hydrolase family protein [unclassified Halanaerobium]|uniref:alpha/beta hydrolase n=1 Tax=unclassified Halanaerobium TaxID=2641197 RepID=UPI000DF372FF|nr:MULTISPECIES: alpha/beta fold hydrolase [unclassified Halanaerobium]RCW41551.1 S-formylglutathione hydrolase FrmB [Halanaerobium sp. MA284_MarDTE_T2]RCW81125.1 S-formylglutathione hydrolase FrmB [Halanaerobium sp. DL-01]